MIWVRGAKYIYIYIYNTIMHVMNINSIWDKFEKLEVIHLNIKWYFNVIMFKINLYIKKVYSLCGIYLFSFCSHEPSNFQSQNYEWNDVQFYVI